MLGATLMLAFSAGAVLLVIATFALTFALFFDQSSPFEIVLFLLGGSLVCGVFALMGLVLRGFGEPRWILIAVLVMAPGVVSGNIALFPLTYNHMAWPITSPSVIALALSWPWALMIIRWRLTRAPLLPWRLPVAVGVYVLLVPLLAAAAHEAQALHLRQTQPELVNTLVLDHPDWDATRISFSESNGYSSTYEDPDGRLAHVFVDIPADEEEALNNFCGEFLEECEFRGEFLVRTDEMTGEVDSIFRDVGESTVNVRWNRGQRPEDPDALIEISEHLRPSTPDDHRWISLRMVDR